MLRPFFSAISIANRPVFTPPAWKLNVLGGSITQTSISLRGQLLDGCLQKYPIAGAIRLRLVFVLGRMETSLGLEESSLGTAASRNLSRMSSFKRINDSETTSLPAEMQELARLIDAMSGPETQALSTAYERVAESILRRRRILNLVQEALSQLRLDVKYLMFDLETTRRERDQFQSQLEEYDSGF